MIAQALIFRDGKVLMVKQQKHGREFWNFPGGHVEKRETPEQACVREVKEETGLDVVLRRVAYAGPDRTVFFADIAGGEPTVEEKSLDWAWVLPGEPGKWDDKTAKLWEDVFGSETK